MKQAIVKRNHGKPGAKLIPISEAMEDLKTIARLKRLPYKFVKEMFVNSGHNVFNQRWKDFTSKPLI